MSAAANLSQQNLSWTSAPLSEWQKHYKAIGRANGYTPQQIKEYGAHITYLAWWAKHLPKEK